METLRTRNGRSHGYPLVVRRVGPKRSTTVLPACTPVGSRTIAELINLINFPASKYESIYRVFRKHHTQFHMFRGHHTQFHRVFRGPPTVPLALRRWAATAGEIAVTSWGSEDRVPGTPGSGDTIWKSTRGLQVSSLSQDNLLGSGRCRTKRGDEPACRLAPELACYAFSHW